VTKITPDIAAMREKFRLQSSSAADREYPWSQESNCADEASNALPQEVFKLRFLEQQ
jgi:hypothetical protein